MRVEQLRSRAIAPVRLVVVLVAALLCLACAATAQAAPDNFVVASNLDSADGAAGDGDCDPNDDGSEADCTLRAAIQEANALDAEGEQHTIGFSGAMTIQPASSLPAVTERIAVNNTADSECNTDPTDAVVLDGQSAVPLGLQIGGQKSLVCGLVVQRFSATSIYVTGAGSVVARNRVGSDAAGATAMGGLHGIGVAADEVLVEANLTSGSSDAGVRVLLGAENAVIRGNLIGTDAAGVADLGNGTGVKVEDASQVQIGGGAAADRNVISGNSFGVRVIGASTGVAIQGNYIGTTATGNAPLSNSNDGVLSTSSGSVTVGGPVSVGAQGTEACDHICNVIAANQTGVNLQAGTGSVAGNHIGVNSLGVGAVGAVAQSTGVWVRDSAAGVTVGGASAARRNLIAGNATGIRISGEEVEGAEVLGNYIGLGVDGTAGIGNTGAGVQIYSAAAGATIGAAGAGNVISATSSGAGSGNTVEGNYIGTDASGTTARPNGSGGIRLTGGTTGTTIGGAGGAGNVISGNDINGVEISGADETEVLGNYLGPDATGAASPGNQASGVSIAKGSGTIVGGAAAGARNVISGNESNGVWVHGSEAEGTAVRGNYVGLAADGDAVLANQFNGVQVSAAAAGTTIGGAGAGEGNVVSGNGTDGVRLENAAATSVLGNFVGTDATGLGDRGNDGNGIIVFDPDAVLGAPGAGNVISGNGKRGISLSFNAVDSTIQANLIGVGADGSVPLGNDGEGVFLLNLAGGLIGGTGPGAGNQIAANGADGVRLQGPSSVGIEILGNSIYANADLGINLVGAAGVDANDPLDADEVPANRGQNYPELATALTEFGETTVTGSLGSEPEHEYRLEFFATPACDESGNGEGRTLLGIDTVTTDAAGDASIDVALPSTAPEQSLTATATDLDPGDPDGTSEFSACLPIPADSTPPDPEEHADPGPGDGADPGDASGSPPAAPQVAGPAPLAASLGLAVLKGRRAAVRGGKARLKLACRGADGAVCRGAVRLTVRTRAGASRRTRRRVLTIGSAAYRLPAGGKRLLAVRLSGRGARLVRRAGRRGLVVRAVGPRLRGGQVRLKPSRR